MPPFTGRRIATLVVIGGVALLGVLHFVTTAPAPESQASVTPHRAVDGEAMASRRAST